VGNPLATVLASLSTEKCTLEKGFRRTVTLGNAHLCLPFQ